jgi:hypothetical protein
MKGRPGRQPRGCPAYANGRFCAPARRPRNRRQGRSDQHPGTCFHDRMPAVSTPASRRRRQPRAAPARSCYRTRECASADRGGRRESNGMPERARPRPGASVGVKEAAATFAPLRATRGLSGSWLRASPRRGRVATRSSRRDRPRIASGSGPEGQSKRSQVLNTSALWLPNDRLDAEAGSL